MKFASPLKSTNILLTVRGHNDFEFRKIPRNFTDLASAFLFSSPTEPFFPSLTRLVKRGLWTRVERVGGGAGGQWGGGGGHSTLPSLSDAAIPFGMDFRTGE